MGKNKKEYTEKNRVWLEEKAHDTGVAALDGATLIFEIELLGIA